MAASSPTLRRLGLVALVLAGLGAAAWFLRDRDPAPSKPSSLEHSPSQSVAPTTSDATAAPVLQGSSTAAPATVPDPREPEAKTWLLTFEVLDADGTPRYWMSGGIHDGEGRILADAEPDLRGDTDADHEWARNRGRVQVPGSGYLAVMARHRVPWVSEWLVPPTSGSRHLIVRLERGLRVEGRVYQQDGVTPLASGTVQAWMPGQDDPYLPPISSRQALIRKDGTFTLEGLPPGTVKLRAKAYDRISGRVVAAEVAAGDEDVRLVLGPQGAIAFLIVDEATGLSPQTPHLGIFTVTDQGEQNWSQATASVLGEPKEAKPSSWYLATPGTAFRFRVKAQRYESSEVISVTVPETGGAQIVRVALRADPKAIAHLTIHLRTHEAALPVLMPVRRHWGGGSSNSTQLPLQDDRLVLELMPGPQHLSIGQAWRPDPDDPDTFWVPADVKLELAPGESRDVQVWVEKGGWVLIDGDPDPRPRVVSLTQGDEVIERHAGWGGWGPKHETGYFLGALRPGMWTLEYAERERRRRTTFDVERGKVTRLDPTTFLTD